MSELDSVAELDQAPALLLHFGAVAQMHLGTENLAEQLWQQALKKSPDLSVA